MLYFVFGVRRSGNHAIIGWLYGLCNNEYVHINDWVNCKLDDFIEFSNITYAKKYNDNKLIPFSGAKNVIISLENVDMSHISNILEYLKKNKIQYTTIHILRDPLNQYASWLKTYGHPNIFNVLFDCYENIMDLMISVDETTSNIYVQYVKWNNNKEYRDAIASKLGFVNNDINFDIAIGHAVSAFENNAIVDHKFYDKRWLRYKNDSIFINTIDKQIINKWKIIASKYNIKMENEYNTFLKNLA